MPVTCGRIKEENAVQSKLSQNFLVLRLEPGDDVFASILKALAEHNVRQGFLVSGIGHFAPVRLGYFIGAGQYAEQDFPDGGEVLNLSGNIALKDGKPFLHLHCTLARDDYSVFGGHLVSATVDVTLEVLVIVIPDEVRMTRKLEESTGLHGLYIE